MAVMTMFLKGRSRSNRSEISTKSIEKVLTIPDQALSLKEIVSRYVRQVPVDVKQYDPVWLDQSEFDLEKVGRSEFSEKMSIAEELRARYDEQVKALEAVREAKRKESEKAAMREEIRQQEAQKEPSREGEA